MDRLTLIVKDDKSNRLTDKFKIDKIEHVQHGTYNAHHIDFTRGKVRGEIQVHDPHSLFESVLNHPIRAKFGEEPPENLQRVKKARAQLGYAMPSYQAQEGAQAIQKVQQGGVV